MTRVVTRKRTGSSPIVVSASISWLTLIVPISAANAAPERPASRIAVISAPSSRSIDRPIRSATKISAPNCFIGIADWNARIRPEQERDQRDDRQRVGARRARRRRQTSRQRIVRRMPDRAEASAAVASPMNSTCTRMSRSMPAVARPISSIAGRRGARGSRSWSSACGSNCRSSASNAGFRFATSTVAVLRLAQQVDEQRDARAVAVVDAGRVDDDRTRAGVRAPRAVRRATRPEWCRRRGGRTARAPGGRRRCR